MYKDTQSELFSVDTSGRHLRQCVNYSQKGLPDNIRKVASELLSENRYTSRTLLQDLRNKPEIMAKIKTTINAQIEKQLQGFVSRFNAAHKIDDRTQGPTEGDLKTWIDQLNLIYADAPV